MKLQQKTASKASTLARAFTFFTIPHAECPQLKSTHSTIACKGTQVVFDARQRMVPYREFNFPNPAARTEKKKLEFEYE